MVTLVGCKPAAQPTEPAEKASPVVAGPSAQYQDELLGVALDNLNRLEEFEPPDVLEQITRRMGELDPKNGEKPLTGDTLLSAWPESEMLRQIVNRLNQWIRSQSASEAWKPDPMVESLPQRFAALPQVRELRRMEFSSFDGYALHEAVLARDLAHWAPGNSLDEVERAKTLFDWVVRNIQLADESDDRIPLFPWETLLFGRGTAAERAWVFILAARQMGLDAAMLGLEDVSTNVAAEKAEASPESSDSSAGTKTALPNGPRPWCVAVLIAGKAYLFDLTIGLPIPAPGGIGRDESGQLSLQPATLAQVVEDEKLLRQLDADEKHPYPVKAADLKRVVVMLEASPTYLARRMKLLESRLAGARRTVLSTSPSAQAEHWKNSGHVAGVQLWRRPFETLDRRAKLDTAEVRSRLMAIIPFYVIGGAPLHRGRLLHLKGRLSGDDRRRTTTNWHGLRTKKCSPHPRTMSKKASCWPASTMPATGSV